MSKKVSLSHIAIPCKDAERSAAFYEKYLEMKVVRRRVDPINIWLSDGIRPFQIALLEEPKVPKLLPAAHLGFTCSSCTQVDRIAAMAKEEGILTYGPKQEGWPGGYVATFEDPDGHNVEISFNQEAAYQALFDPITDLDALADTMKDGDERWE